MLLAQPPRRRAAFLAACLPAMAATACIEDRLVVEFATRVDASGACHRRVSYRLQRVETETGDAPRPIPADQDPLTLFHRFPEAAAWTVSHGLALGVHEVVAEAHLAFAQEADGDYWRRRSPRALPARNHVSFALDSKQGVYEYAETFLDPSSPLAAARLLAEGLSRRDRAFSRAFTHALPPAPPVRSDTSAQAFRERFAQPLRDRVAALAESPIHGPRERREIQDLLHRISELAADLADHLAGLAPVEDEGRVREAVDKALEALSEPLQEELRQAGLALPSVFPQGPAPIRFRYTLTLPGTIVRANACAQGDTAGWEFEQDDLYGHGFEIWARSETR